MNKNIDIENDPIYEPPPRGAHPVTILKARYCGAYEGGLWVAFNLREDEIPGAAQDDDTTCAAWWADNAARVGRGKTPNEALADLERRLASS